MHACVLGQTVLAARFEHVSQHGTGSAFPKTSGHAHNRGRAPFAKKVDFRGPGNFSAQDFSEKAGRTLVHRGVNDHQVSLGQIASIVASQAKCHRKTGEGLQRIAEGLSGGLVGHGHDSTLANQPLRYANAPAKASQAHHQRTNAGERWPVGIREDWFEWRLHLKFIACSEQVDIAKA
jgi:hypothetical protein